MTAAGLCTEVGEKEEEEWDGGGRGGGGERNGLVNIYFKRRGKREAESAGLEWSELSGRQWELRAAASTREAEAVQAGFAQW